MGCKLVLCPTSSNSLIVTVSTSARAYGSPWNCEQKSASETVLRLALPPRARDTRQEKSSVELLRTGQEEDLGEGEGDDGRVH